MCSCVLLCLKYCTAGNLLVPGAHQLPFRLTPEGSGCLLGQLEHQRVALMVDAAALSTKQVGEPVGHCSCSCPEDNLGPLCHELLSHAECNSGLSSKPLSCSETNSLYGTHQSLDQFMFPVFGTH